MGGYMLKGQKQILLLQDNVKKIVLTSRLTKISHVLEIY